MSKDTKADLEAKIHELEEKFQRLATTLETDDEVDSKSKKLEECEAECIKRIEDESKVHVLGHTPVGHDEIDTIKQVVNARDEANPRAGLVKNTNEGSVLREDKPQEIKMPVGDKTLFNGDEDCNCDCHPHNNDCLKCYAHPKHWEEKLGIIDTVEPPITEESIEEIPPKKKSIWSRLKKW